MASTGEPWRLGRRPALDGLRGVAVLMVVANHTGLADLKAAGSAGVTVFFTLSGFLITSLLLQERATAGAISFRAFYVRRARRLLPALFCMVGIVGGGVAALGYGWSWFAREAAPAVFYFANWNRMTGEVVGFWSHTWSLSIEEQFYLAAPVLLILLARWGRKGIVAVAAVSSVYAVAARVLLWDGGEGFNRVYYALDTRADALLVGCALAAIMHGRREQRSQHVVAAVLLAVVVALSGTGSFGAAVLVPSVVPLATAGMIFCLAQGEYAGWLTRRPLVLIGQRSYGLYLWHYPLFLLLHDRLPGSLPVVVVQIVTLSWLMTLASWRYVEQPFLRANSRSRPRVESRPAVTVAAGRSV